MQSNSIKRKIHDLTTIVRASSGFGKSQRRGPGLLLRTAVFGMTSFLLTAGACSLDGGGRLSGLVTDPSGSAIVGVTVLAVNSETGLKYETVTNAEGFYAQPALPGP
jgi:hypothetical protein